jgi:putative FmdB family regulatory protein
MPLYEYACQECRHTFETLVFDGEKVECPQCRGERLERLLSLPAKPQTGSASLPVACNRDLPPCGAPNCCRL